MKDFYYIYFDWRNNIFGVEKDFERDVLTDCILDNPLVLRAYTYNKDNIENLKNQMICFFKEKIKREIEQETKKFENWKNSLNNKLSYLEKECNKETKINENWK